MRDVINQSRVAAILFPLHPARMFHILLFTVGGGLSAWCFLGRDEEDNYFTKVSEKYVNLSFFKGLCHPFPCHRTPEPKILCTG